MEKQVLIFLDREFGSGGHKVAQQIAERLNIPYYDYNFLAHMFEENPELVKKMEAYDEKAPGIFGSRHVRGHTNSIEEHLINMQFEFIKKKADRGDSFVVVGRCAEVILSDFPNLISMFVMADKEAKIARVMDREGKTREESIKKMKRIDDMHRRHFNMLSDKKWGASKSYDICVRSSDMEITELVDILMPYIEARIKRFS